MSTKIARKRFLVKDILVRFVTNTEQTAPQTLPFLNALGLCQHTDLWGLTQFSPLAHLFPLRKARPFSSTRTCRGWNPSEAEDSTTHLLYTARHSDSAKPKTYTSYTLCSFKLPYGIQAVSIFSPWVAWALPKKWQQDHYSLLHQELHRIEHIY